MRFLFWIAGLALAATTASGQTKKYQVAPGVQAMINHAEGSRIVKVLMPGVEAIELELAQSPANAFMIKTADYNFDGYKDFAMMSVNQQSGTQVYEVFLYHPAEKTFEALEVPGGVCESFGNLRLSAGEKLLRSNCRQGSKASQDVFRWTDHFTLELVKSVDNSAETRAEKAEEKAEVKTEKADKRKEKRDERKEKREEEKDDEE